MPPSDVKNTKQKPMGLIAQLLERFRSSMRHRPNRASVTRKTYSCGYSERAAANLDNPIIFDDMFEFFAFVLMFALLVKPEEQMMLERFGSDYENYMNASKRLIPGAW